MTSNRTDVCFFLPNLGEGGIQRTAINLADSFVNKGLKVDFVLDRVTGPFVKQIPDGSRMIDLKYPRLRTSVYSLISYLKREQPKALISYTHYHDEIAILAKRLSGVSTKIAVSTQNTLLGTPRPPIQNLPGFLGITPYYPHTLIKLFYPWADAVLASSGGVAQDVAQISGLPLEQIKVIYNPIVTPKLLERAKEPVDHPWFKTGEPPVILGVGRLTKQKDFETLIQAFYQVRKQQNARLMILGTGLAQARLQSLLHQLGVENDVNLQGFVENPYAYMARAKLFVLSSAWEGFGNVLVEAMAVGTPVISTDCQSGLAEILDHGKYGFLTPVGDYKAMAEEILKVLSGRYKLVDATWLNQFSIENSAQKYLEALSQT
ncbi:glycosyltransferase [Limnoraphis robusta Tam1]|uniref:Glycosyltransferase n=1 Tax=Limnoraphis robusta CCNP1315 TaxID=3110306 RepID=A0ABU5TXP6_9CYAN|nr:glycosyltransferase [Limnoraphis robusta]MEA5497268.1 glycosyltransferase [Limnoraphis robusta BA-68 BA1]MEA5519686.1 glycosyltransferase [Limnoraphis robusta CCNP1315]MEA5540153.1 glycosyltransferase [Limnoraphis robusta Tam1]MEA5544820.1 glycosyltransferase [Limnoraphis robusta CCNP1324]